MLLVETWERGVEIVVLLTLLYFILPVVKVRTRVTLPYHIFIAMTPVNLLINQLIQVVVEVEVSKTLDKPDDCGELRMPNLFVSELPV